MNTYKVVSISPSLSSNESGTKLASDLEAVVQKYAAEGWEFVNIETLSTFVEGSSGCFGIGAQPPYNTNYQMIVFKRSSY